MELKVFCIGLHKTGTTSIHRFFEEMGIKSFHDPSWSQKPLPRGLLNKFEAFSDGGGHCWNDNLEFGGNHEVRELDSLYGKKAKYILNHRDMVSWLTSKMLHFDWYINVFLKKYSEDIGMKVLKKWLLNRYLYHKKIEEYFLNRNDILSIDITKNPSAVYDIVNFLNITNLEKDISSKMPHHNTRKNQPYREFCHSMAKIVAKEMKNYVEEDQERLFRINKNIKIEY